MKARSSSLDAVVEKLCVVTLVALDCGWSPNATASMARAGAVATVTLMVAEVVEFPAPSRARAESVCPPSDVVVVSHVTEYRSEERRVGKECRSSGAGKHEKKK